MVVTLASVVCARAVEVTPVYDVRFFSGQHFFNGSMSAVSGNVNAVVSPAVKFSDRWSLIPTYAGGYRGTRDVQELAGGGTLFQDSSHSGLNVKGIYQPTGSLKIKPTAGGRFEWLRETKDEKWGKGLFDYRKYTGGLETEYAFSPKAGARAGYDYYTLAFPNYKSLESSQDSTLSRELAGQNTLDSANHMVSLGGWTPLPGRLHLDLAAYYTKRSYGQQPVVVDTGNLSTTDRGDTVMAAQAAVSRPLALGKSLRFLAELGVSYAATDSNQNHYDARKTVFVADYYDYTQLSYSPRLTAALGGRPWIFDTGAVYTSRRYGSRPVQDAQGDYLTTKLSMTEISSSFGMSYPVTKYFKLRAVSNLGWSRSNMKYEKVYRYNYRIANYMMGFSYEY